MKRVDNRQYKLTEIRPRRIHKKKITLKRGRRYDSKLDRRGMKEV